MAQVSRKNAGGSTGVVAAVILHSSSFLLASSFLVAQDSRPLPDFAALSDAVRKNLAKSERLDDLYAFRERRTDLHTNPFGKIGTDGTRLSEVYPSSIPQLTYRRLIERNGVPIDAAQRAQQDREYKAKVADVQRRAAGQTDAERKRQQEEDAAARRRGQTRIDDVVDALQFKLEGRTMHHGVPALVVSFSPRPGARPTTREGRTAQKFSGTVWIHAGASEVMRVEAKAVDDLSFGLGIVARLGEGTTATFVRQPVDDGVWMPTELRLSGRGRAALVRRLVIDFSLEWFDYWRLPGPSPTPFLDYGEMPRANAKSQIPNPKLQSQTANAN
jgi:hypothetical protein